MTLVFRLAAVLLLWALGSLGASVVGLYAQTGERARSFWFMTGLWGLVDGAIAWYALVWPPASPSVLAPVLRLNAGLDVAYLAVAAVLLLQRGPRARGFGLAVAVQGAFLLAFDVTFWRWCLAAVR